MKNWKTSIAGIAAGLLVALPTIVQTATTPEGAINWPQLCTGIALAAIGLLAKDHNVTGGSVTQNDQTPQS